MSTPEETADYPNPSAEETVSMNVSFNEGIRFRILRPHAAGGLGEVFVANDLEIRREVALKQIREQHADDPDRRSRFLQEAEITGGLEHPGIVPVYGQGAYPDGRPYYAMRLIRGRSMKEETDGFHTGGGKFDSVEFRGLLQRFVDVCHAVEYAHSRGVLHRDLKPANIMLGKYGETLVVDWGLAKAVGSKEELTELEEGSLHPASGNSATPTQMGSAVGTPAFMSPEQAAGRLDEIGPASDVFSLGATLYYLLTGQASQTDNDLFVVLRKVEECDFPPPRKINSAVPRPLQAVCLKAMSRAPSDRYASAASLANDVERWLADHRVSAHTETRREHAGRWMRHHRSVVASVAVGFVLSCIAAVVGIALWERSERESFKLQQQRHARIAELKADAEAAENSALAELRAGRFDSAAKFLQRALDQLDDGEQFDEVRPRLEGQLDRVERLVKFYRHSSQAEDNLLFERDRQAIAAGQVALDALGVFDHADWWAHLPSEGLTPRQADRLQRDAYAQLTNLSLLFAKIGLFKNSRDELKRARQVAALAQSYRRSEMIASVADICGNKLFLAGMGADVISLDAIETVSNVMNWQPLPGWNWRPLKWQAEQKPMSREFLAITNPTDGYLFGAFDAATSTDDAMYIRTMAELGLLPGVSGSLDEAQRKMTAAVRLDPDRFLYHITLAWCEVLRKDFEAARRALGQAIMLRPHDPLGFAMRSGAWFDEYEAADENTTREQRAFLLSQALRDADHATHLSPTSYAVPLYRAQAMLAAGQTTEALAAYRRCIELSDRRTVTDLARLANPLHQGMVQNRDRLLKHLAEKSIDRAEVSAVLAAIVLRLGDEAHAEKLVQQALRIDADVPFGRVTLGEIQLQRREWKSAADSFRKAIAGGQSSFQTWIGLAHAATNLGETDEAGDAAQHALAMAETDWQFAMARASRAEYQLKQDKIKEAASLASAAWDADPTVDLEPLRKLAVQTQADAVLQKLDELKTIGTRDANAGAVRVLPLLNGDFELGLAPYWADDHAASGRPIWFNSNSCRSSAGVVAGTRPGAPGSLCLRLRHESDAAPGRYGTMSQRLPIKQDATYRLSVWAKTRDLSPHAVVFRVEANGESKTLELPAGTHDWQSHSLTFSLPAHELQLKITTRAPGECWIDDIRIERE